MKNLLSLLVVTICLCSGCKSYRDFLSVEDYQNLNNKMELLDGQFIMVDVNGKSLKMLFDTGSSATSVSDIKALGGEEIFTEDNFSSVASVTGYNGESIKISRLKTDSIITPITRAYHRKVLVENFKVQIDCIDHGQDRQGIFGTDTYKGANFPIVLDYENSQIYFATGDSIPQGYVEIPSQFKHNKFNVLARFGEKTIPMQFDTGNIGGILLKDSKGVDLSNRYSYKTLMQGFNDQIDTFQIELGQIKEMNMGTFKIEKFPISIIPDGVVANMGLEFINKFNWIIDFQNKKMYAKKILDIDRRDPSEQVKQAGNAVVPINGDLIIALKNDDTSTYNVGDKIIAIDGENIDEANLCTNFELLNTNKDWGSFKIETTPKF